MEERLKRIFWILITPTVLFFLLVGAFQYFIWPPLSDWIKQEISRTTRNETPFIVSVENLDWKIFKPTLVFSKVKIQTQGELKEIVPELEISEVRAQMDPFQLLTGRLGFSLLEVEGPNFKLNMDPLLDAPSSSKELPLTQLFKTLSLVPIQRLLIKDIQLAAKSEKNKFEIQIKEGQLGFLLQPSRLQIKLKLDQAHIQGRLGQLPFKVNSLFQLSPTQLKILEFQTEVDKNSFLVEGDLNQFQLIQIQPQVQLKFKTNLFLNSLGNILKTHPQFKKIPTMDGQLSAEGNIQTSSLEQLKGDFKINSKDLKIENFDLGSTMIDGQFKNQSVIIKKLEANHPAGHALLHDTQLTFDSEMNFKTQVEVSELDLQKLFLSLDLKNIPVELLINGNLPCQGQIKNFNLTCEGLLRGRKLHVNSSGNMKGTPIVEIEEFSTKGTVSVDLEKVKYNAQIQLSNNSGESQGEIKYSEGFKISYRSPEVHFQNIKNLGNLKFEGSVAVEGATEGNSDAATFYVNAQAKDFVFENYQLGQMTTVVNYEKGHLYLKNITGLMSQSTYQGQLDINFQKEDILGLMEFPQLNLKDVTTAFQRIYQFPLEVQGAGQARIRFEGPLDFWRLSYRLESEFKNGKISNDSFSDLKFNVSALDGNIRADNVQIRKNESEVTVTGSISSQKKFSLSAVGNNIKLEESESMNTLNNQIFGRLDLTAKLEGPLTDPQFSWRAQINETIIDEQEMPPTDFDGQLTKNQFNLRANLFGEKIKSEIQWPMSENAVPLKIKFKSKDWNFTQWIGLFDKSFVKGEYSSYLTGEVDLSSQNGDLFQSTGEVQIVNFFMQRGPLFLQNQGPALAQFENGKIKLKNFVFQGTDNTFNVSGENFTLYNMDIQIKGSLELRLLHMLFPFFEDIGGPLKLTTSLSGPLFKPQILGTADLRNVYFRFKGFPHTIEKINAEVLFSHSKVLIQNIRGQLGGGSLSGQGELTINGLRDLPTSLKIQAENMSLQVPEKVRTNGSADLLLSGNWFPFTISGTYNVNSALVDKEFGEDEKLVSSTLQVNYLPKALQETNFEPILLNLQVNLERNIEIKNSLLNGLVTGQIQVTGPPTNPLLFGKINIEKTAKLNIKDKIFELQTGNLIFNNPKEINPELYLTGSARVEEYDINLLVQGTAKSPLIRLTSLPPLSEKDIFTLLALGATSTQLEQKSQSASYSEQAGYEIGAAVLSKTALAKNLQSRLGVDFQITSSFDSKSNAFVRKAVFRKKLTKKINVSYSAPIRDSKTSDSGTSEAKLEYSINKNLSTNLSIENSSEESSNKEKSSILGLDLEFRRDFR